MCLLFWRDTQPQDGVFEQILRGEKRTFQALGLVLWILARLESLEVENVWMGRWNIKHETGKTCF